MKRFLIALLALGLLFGMGFLMAGCEPDEPVDEPVDEPDPDEPVDEPDDPEETFSWRHQVAYSEADMEYIALEPFFEAIYERSGGRLEITAYPAGTIVPEEEQLEACERGVIDVSHAYGGYFRDVVPVGDIEGGLPGQWPGFGYTEDAEHMLYDFEDGALAELFREAYREQGGVYYLGSHSYSGYPVINSVEPIETMEDLQGMIVRATGAWVDLLEAAGVSTTFVPGAEMYTELSLGTIDAATWSVEGFIDYAWYEVAPYFHVPTISPHSKSHMKINLDSWNALPEDIQQIVHETYREVYIPELHKLYEAMWEEVYEKEEELGYTVVDHTAVVEELRELAAAELWPEVEERDEYTRRAVEIINRWYEEHEEGDFAP